MATRTNPSATTTASNPPELVPLEVLLGNPERIGPAISPDGRRLAWIAPHEGVLNVWARDLDAAADSARVVTDNRDRGVGSFAWAPDGTRILYPQDVAGDEMWQLCDVHLDTGEQRELTPAGVQAYMMKVSTEHPNTILVSLNLDSPLHEVYRLDLDTGALTRICSNPGFLGFVADQDLRVRAALAPLPDGGMVIMVRDSEQADWRPLLPVGYDDAMSTAPIGFSAHGNRLLCITSHEAETTQLVWVDMATGDRDLVYSDPGNDVTAALLHASTHAPRLAYVQRERLDTVVLDPSIQADIDALAGLDGDLQILGGDTADRMWLVASAHDDGPIHYYLYRRDTRHTDYLFSHQPALGEHTLAPMEPITLSARDGLTLHGYATFPPGAQRKMLPTVLLVHGGPWHRDTWGFDPQVQWLANRGYLVLQVNFRGSTGYGKRFLNAGNRQWGTGMQNDLIDTVNWAISQGWTAPARVAAFGRSYGGYAALCGAAYTPDVFCCAVAFSPPTNLATMITAIPAHARPVLDQAHRRIGNPDTEADFLWSRSPISRVDDIGIPLLIAQGANDPRVPRADTDQFVNALRKLDKPVQYQVFTGEGHHVATPEDRVDFYREAEQFLAEHLRANPHHAVAP